MSPFLQERGQERFFQSWLTDSTEMEATEHRDVSTLA